MRVVREREEEKDPMSISLCIYKEMKLQNGDRTKKRRKKMFVNVGIRETKSEC